MNEIWKITLVVVPCYLLGAIPSSFIIGKLVKGIDLRDHGSGNLGAANTFRVLGTKAALPVLLFDIVKGFLAVKLVSLIGLEGFIYPLLAALIVIVGHNYSVFVGFSGGKGVGTTTGAFLAMAPLAVGICFLLWLVMLALFRIVSVASIVSTLMLPVAIIISNRFFGSRIHISVTYLAIIAALMVLYKHRSNIRRLINGTENKIF